MSIDAHPLTNLHRRALKTPDKLAIVSLDRRADPSDQVTFAQLHSRVLGASHGLRLQTSGPVLLSLSDPIEFAIAFLACLNAGRVAVPAPALATPQLKTRAFDIHKKLQMGPVVTGAQELEKWGETGAKTATIADLANAGIDAPAPPNPQDIAFVQFSSGSTGQPKGIAITNANLAANTMMIRSAFSLSADDVGVNWLPFFHDMGLVGTLLEAISVGLTSYFLPTLGFVQQPKSWFTAIQRYGGTVIGGPNFGYDMCNRRITKPDPTLDLSSVRVAFCGAEPIKPQVLHQFADRFRGNGFDPNTFLPCYGMAEGTLICACAPVGRDITLAAPAGQENPKQYVSCGHAPPMAEFAIADPDSDALLPDGTQGEICIAGPHVSPGLWDPASGTISPFPRRIGLNNHDYLRTGDIGFIQNAELYPIDRQDGAMNIRGRIIYSVDIETAVAHRYPDGEIHKSAAICVERDQQTGITVVIEVLRAHWSARNTLASDLQTCLADQFGIRVEVEPVVRGTLPMTTSGKIARHRISEALNTQPDINNLQTENTNGN